MFGKRILLHIVINKGIIRSKIPQTCSESYVKKDRNEQIPHIHVAGNALHLPHAFHMPHVTCISIAL